MSFVLLRLSAPRPTFPADATPAERAAMGAHAAFWQAHADAGRAIAVGPVLDPAGAWGLAIVRADTTEAALALAAADPVLAEPGFAYTAAHFGGMILPRG